MVLAVIVMDYQNVHLTGAEVFNPGAPRHMSLIHPALFAEQWRQCRLSAGYAPFTSTDEIDIRVRVHRGLPDSSLAGYRRNQSQQAHWEASSTHRVTVFHRPLRYSKVQGFPSGWQIDPATGREKGIDVAVALDVVEWSTHANIVVLASVDTDLEPALEFAKANGSAKVETTSWFDPSAQGGRRQLRTKPPSWNTRMDKNAFFKSIDHRDYP